MLLSMQKLEIEPWRDYCVPPVRDHGLYGMQSQTRVIMSENRRCTKHKFQQSSGLSRDNN